MPSTPKRGGSLAATLKRLLRGRKRDQIKLGDLVDEVEVEEGPGPVLFVLTLPILLPMPPGVSMLLALPLLIVAPQIMVGRRELWIPQALAKRTIERAKLAKLVRRILPSLSRVERLVRPRLQMLTGRVGASLVGVAATVLAIVLVLPLPPPTSRPRWRWCCSRWGCRAATGSSCSPATASWRSPRRSSGSPSPVSASDSAS